MAGIDKCSKLVIHGDGSDNGTTITDSSPFAKVIFRAGNTCTKTGVKKFGTASLYFDGSSDYLNAPDHADWVFDQNDFCIDFWINFSTLPASNATVRMVSQYLSASVYWAVSYIDVSGTKSLVFQNNGTTICTYNVTFTTGQWYHIAVSRYYTGGTRTTRLFIDGAIVHSVTTDYTVSDVGAVLNIGGSTGAYFTGYIDEIRVSHYDPRWIDTFTPPTEAYSAGTTWHINPLTGNDEFSGSSWTSAWKTIKYGASTIPAPGDTIKIAKSPDPVSIGNATWTNKSATVTLASALTQDIDLCDSGWTGVANITVAHDTVTKKQGTAGLKLTPLAAFTIGKMAYKALAAPLDLSAYTAISFWTKTPFSASYGLKICLCSDTTGDTPVDTFYVHPADMFVTSYWTPRRISKGSALGSSIQSIAIYIDVDPVTNVIYFDNIMACNDFSLYSMITKKDSNNAYEAWYSIQSIVGTTVLLDQDSGNNYNVAQGYYGTGGTVETYRREPFYILTESDCVPQEAGTAGNLIWYYGGWDTALDEVTGQTYFDGLGVCASGLIQITVNYIKMHRINVVRAYAGVSISGNYCEIDFECISSCFGSGLYITGIYTSCVGKFITSINKAYNAISLIGYANTVEVDQIINSGIGVSSNGIANKLTFDLIANMYHTSYSGILIRSNDCKFFGGIIKDNAINGVCIYDSTGNNHFYDILFQDNVRDVQYNSSSYGIQHFINCTLESATPFYDGGLSASAECRLIRIAGDINNNIVYTPGGYVQSQVAIRYSTGIAWKMSPTVIANAYDRLPLVLPLAKVAVAANTQVTVTAWMLRTDSGITGKLVCPEKQIAGVVSEVSSSLTDTGGWQQLTIQFTPTEAGVVEIQAQCYGGTEYSVYIDSISISQG